MDCWAYGLDFESFGLDCCMFGLDCWMFGLDCEAFGLGCWVYGLGDKMLDSGCFYDYKLEPDGWVLDFGGKLFDFDGEILDSECRMVGFGRLVFVYYFGWSCSDCFLFGFDDVERCWSSSVGSGFAVTLKIIYI